MTTQEVADRLNVSRAAVYQLVYRGAIPVSRRGQTKYGKAQLVFDENEIEEWLRGVRLVTPEEAAIEIRTK